MSFIAQYYHRDGFDPGEVEGALYLPVNGASNFIAHHYQLSARVSVDSQDVNASLLMLERILDLLEADETFDASSGKARKLLRGTDVVLLEKDVSGSTLRDSVEFVEQ